MPKIMIVDDAAFMRMRASKVLTENGYEVVEAVDGEDAIHKYRLERPDIVLMDITMPRMDGISAVKAIMSDDPSARVVMCSALGQQSSVMESIKAGARDFILKPFQPDKMLTTIKRVLE